MPAGLNPGVYVEESGPGPRPITGVSTSVAAFVGLAQAGPLTPTAITSFAEYAATYGDFAPKEYLAHAVKGFFQNGGVRCYILRVPPELRAGPQSAADADAISEYASALLTPLEPLSEVSLVCCPDEHALPGMAAALVAHCERLKYRIAILAAPRDAFALAGPPKVTQSSFAAYYMPWLLVEDRAGGAALTIHPGGHIAGAMVRCDLQHGVWKAPANIAILGIAGLQRQITTEQQETLNSLGVNVLRNFPGRGNLIWGARTTSQDPEWKYINLRRYFIYLEKSIDEGTQWVVFENNGETLWGSVQRTISDFLFNEFQRGALSGSKPDDAFFVKCDRSTMTQNDLDNGRLICLVGVAPLRPAEFIIFRICQSTADAASPSA